jgi:hypothetical protein
MINKFSCLLFCGSLLAQSPNVLVTNNSSLPYDGIVRVLLPTRPIYDGGWNFTLAGPGGMTGMFPVVNTIYSVGHQTIDGKWSVDLHVKLSAWEQRLVDLDSMDRVISPVPVLPNNLLAAFGGLPVINNITIPPVNVITGANNITNQKHTGLGFTALLAENINSNLAATVEITWYPYNYGWMRGLVTLKSTQDYLVPKGGITMRWKGASVFPLNRPPEILLPVNYQLTGGVEVQIPITVAWLDRVPNNRADSAWIDVNHLVTAVQQ